MLTDKQLQAEAKRLNSLPMDSFLGLSPSMVHTLLYTPFDKSSLLKINDLSDEMLDQIPLFAIAEDLLHIIQRDNHIKLTLRGALPKKIVIELYSKKHILDSFIEVGYNKLNRESDCDTILGTRVVLELAELLTKERGKLRLTNKALNLLEQNNRQELFNIFFKAFITQFNWGYYDRFPESRMTQTGWGFSIYMLKKFGKEPQTINHYGRAYLTAFPSILDEFDSYMEWTKDEFYIACYCTRVFTKFLLWFGLVTIDREDELLYTDSDMCKTTPLFDELFTIK